MSLRITALSRTGARRGGATQRSKNDRVGDESRGHEGQERCHARRLEYLAQRIVEEEVLTQRFENLTQEDRRPERHNAGHPGADESSVDVPGGKRKQGDRDQPVDRETAAESAVIVRARQVPIGVDRCGENQRDRK